jgi:hypothetical protein
MFLWNFDSYKNHTASSYPRRLHSPLLRLWKHKILQWCPVWKANRHIRPSIGISTVTEKTIETVAGGVRRELYTRWEPRGLESLSLWRWRRYVHPKRQLLQEPRGVICHKAALLNLYEISSRTPERKREIGFKTMGRSNPAQDRAQNVSFATTSMQFRTR